MLHLGCCSSPRSASAKADSSFPLTQFAIEGFSSPFRLDRNSSVGGIMLFVRPKIASKFLSQCKPNSSVENIFLEINLQSKKWLLSCSYNPNLTSPNNHIQNISRTLDFYSSKFNKTVSFSEMLLLKFQTPLFLSFVRHTM